MGQHDVERLPLSPPPLSKRVTVLSKGLEAHFAEVTATITPCSDLRQPPYNLATQGLSGSSRFANIGGPPHLHHHPSKSTTYDLLTSAAQMEMCSRTQPDSLLGTSAGDFTHLCRNSELMLNISWISDGKLTNRTRIASITPNKEPAFSSDCAYTRFGLMGNHYGCTGRSRPRSQHHSAQTYRLP